MKFKIKDRVMVSDGPGIVTGFTGDGRVLVRPTGMYCYASDPSFPHEPEALELTSTTCEECGTGIRSDYYTKTWIHFRRGRRESCSYEGTSTQGEG